jgi:hypothetical protein
MTKLCAQTSTLGLTPLVPSSLEIATITYRSGPEWEQRFGRKMLSETTDEQGNKVIGVPSLSPDFLIETYLDHQVSARRATISRLGHHSCSCLTCCFRANDSASLTMPTR